MENKGVKKCFLKPLLSYQLKLYEIGHNRCPSNKIQAKFFLVLGALCRMIQVKASND